MHTKMKISTRLLLTFFIIILTFASVTYLILHQSRRALQYSFFEHLKSVREDKKLQLQRFIAECENDMHVLRDIVKALQYTTFQKIESVQHTKRNLIERYFKERLHDMKALSTTASFAQALHQSLIGKNAPADESTTATTAEKKQNELIASIKRKLTQVQTEYGYQDLLLINKKGQIIFSLNQKIEEGSNVIESHLKITPLYTAFQQGLKALTIQDYMPYPPANNQYRAFLSIPISFEEQIVGTFIVSMTHAELNTILQNRAGMGETGETYLVGKIDNITSYRSDRVMKGEKSELVIGRQQTGEDIEKALTGESGVQIKMGITGKLELGGYTPVKVPNTQWAMITTISLEEAIKAKLPDENKDLFTKYTEQYGYYDLFLIHPDGEIFYAVKRENDYGTNILTGKYSNTQLSKTVQKTLTSHSFAISDYAPYPPSNNLPAAFAAIPLVNEENKIELIIAVQLGEKTLNEIMRQRAGMGETGEAYLVGSDKLMRSNSYNNPVSHSIQASFANPLQGTVDTIAARDALMGKTGIAIIKDYRDTFVLSAYTPFSFGETVWALMVEIDQAEAFVIINKLERWTLIIALISLIVIIGIAILLIRSIKNPLQYLVTVSQSIAAGNLTNKIKITRQDELGQLLRAFSEMQQKLYTITESLQETVLVVSNAAEEISKSSTDLSQRTEEQAASLEQTSASMEQMTSTVQQNADNADQAKQLAKQATDQATQGGEVIGKTIHAMTEISNSSKKVADIISVIDEIAFQTNLLALNAAVEAARAGEQGRGFAVVASEVRHLAQRSAVSAKEIRELIQDSMTKVEEGTALANQSGATLQQIVNAVKKVNTMIEEIAAASQEQSSGIKQVNNVVSQMDQMVQQNAALVEESTTASEIMRQQAQKLKAQIQYFNIGKESEFEEKPPFISETDPVKKPSINKKQPKTNLSQTHQSEIHQSSPHWQTSQMQKEASQVKKNHFEEDNEWRDF